MIPTTAHRTIYHRMFTWVRCRLACGTIRSRASTWSLHRSHRSDWFGCYAVLVPTSRFCCLNHILRLRMTERALSLRRIGAFSVQTLLVGTIDLFSERIRCISRYRKLLGIAKILIFF